MRPLLAIALLLALPSTAQADWRIERAQKIAEVVWNHPCGGHVTVERGDAAKAVPSAIPTAPPKAWIVQGSCVVVLNGFWERQFGFDWNDICGMLLHEYGHVAGVLEHSKNPRSIMRENLDDGPPDPRCRKRGRPFLEKHGLLIRRRSRPSSA